MFVLSEKKEDTLVAMVTVPQCTVGNGKKVAAGLCCLERRTLTQVKVLSCVTVTAWFQCNCRLLSASNTSVKSSLGNICFVYH